LAALLVVRRGNMDTAAPGRGASPHLLLLAVASLLLLLLSPRAAAQPWPACGSTGRYTANSSYQSNLASLATALPANASRPGALFATGSAGAVPDIAYALALCRGDAANATACGACVATAFQDAQQLCAFAKDAAVYYDACYLRFSNRNFLGDTASNGGELILMNALNVSSPVGAFDAAVRGLLNAAGGYAANSSRRFATGEGAFDAANPTIYGLTQCTPDMSPADCRSCLGGIISMAPQYLSGSQGGRVIRMRCNFRYEVYSFFSGAPSLRLPAPAPPPTPVNVTPTAATPGETPDTNLLSLHLLVWF